MNERRHCVCERDYFINSLPHQARDVVASCRRTFFFSCGCSKRTSQRQSVHSTGPSNRSTSFCLQLWPSPCQRRVCVSPILILQSDALSMRPLATAEGVGTICLFCTPHLRGDNQREVQDHTRHHNVSIAWGT